MSGVLRFPEARGRLGRGGVLEPLGETPQDWCFTGASLHRARLALWLTRDLEINLPGVALALDLFDEIAALQAHQQRLGPR